MGKNCSLLTVMNDVSRSLDARAAKPALLSRGPVSEIMAFAALDPLLASLYKSYMDAKAMRAASELEYGAADGMTDMAVIMEDSAWCAMQTRYMEVRKDRILMKQAQDLIEDARLEEEAASLRAKEKQALQFFLQMQMMAYIHKKANQAVYLWYALLMLRGSNQPVIFAPHYATHHFNRLAA